MKTHYPFLISRDTLYLDFDFQSEGPKGTIKKVVRYVLRDGDGSTFFELAFGDRKSETKDFDHMVVSNNSDMKKILATVAETTVEFTKRFPDLAVIALGSTLTRTRLYQMMISNNLEAIQTVFDVYGLRNQTWEPFERNTSYEAFALQRK
jgi:hypothetical protein